MSNKNAVDAVRTTFTVLKALVELDGAGVTRLSDRLRIPKSTIHNHLTTLREDGWIVKDRHDQYHVGFRFVDVSYHAKRRLRIYDMVKREVNELAEESGEMTLFTVEEHGMGVCLYRKLGPNAIETPLYVGYRSTLHHTAVGKAILAFLPEERVEEIIERRGLESETEHTITDRDELYAELEEIRETGVAYNHQETITGLVGVGVPIKRQNGSVVGAVSIIGPTSRMGTERLDEYLTMIQRSVNVIEINSTTV